MALIHGLPKFNPTAPTDCNHVSSLAGLYQGRIPASPQHHPELCLVLRHFTNGFVCKFTYHGVICQDALTGSRYTIICPHVPKDRSQQVSGGGGEGSRDQENYFSPHQEFFFSAFFRMTVNRVGRDVDGPSSTALHLLPFH